MTSIESSSQRIWLPSESMSKVLVVLAFTSFLVAECLSALGISFRRELHLGSGLPLLYLFPVWVGLPLLAAWQAYHHLRKRFVGPDGEKGSSRALRYWQATVVIMSYVPILFTMGLLLPALKSKIN
jgi:hypothetical protein